MYGEVIILFQYNAMIYNSPGLNHM